MKLGISCRGGSDPEAARDRGSSGREDHVEGVTLGANLGSGMLGDLVADQAAVRVEQLRRGLLAARLDE